MINQPLQRFIRNLDFIIFYLPIDITATKFENKEKSDYHEMKAIETWVNIPS